MQGGIASQQLACDCLLQAACLAEADSAAGTAGALRACAAYAACSNLLLTQGVSTAPAQGLLHPGMPSGPAALRLALAGILRTAHAGLAAPGTPQTQRQELQSLVSSASTHWAALGSPLLPAPSTAAPTTPAASAASPVQAALPPPPPQPSNTPRLTRPLPRPSLILNVPVGRADDVLAALAGQAAAAAALLWRTATSAQPSPEEPPASLACSIPPGTSILSCVDVQVRVVEGARLPALPTPADNTGVTADAAVQQHCLGMPLAAPTRHTLYSLSLPPHQSCMARVAVGLMQPEHGGQPLARAMELSGVTTGQVMQSLQKCAPSAEGDALAQAAPASSLERHLSSRWGFPVQRAGHSQQSQPGQPHGAFQPAEPQEDHISAASSPRFTRDLAVGSQELSRPQAAAFAWQLLGQVGIHQAPGRDAGAPTLKVLLEGAAALQAAGSLVPASEPTPLSADLLEGFITSVNKRSDSFLLGSPTPLPRPPLAFFGTTSKPAQSGQQRLEAALSGLLLGHSLAAARFREALQALPPPATPAALLHTCLKADRHAATGNSFEGLPAVLSAGAHGLIRVASSALQQVGAAQSQTSPDAVQAALLKAFPGCAERAITGATFVVIRCLLLYQWWSTLASATQGNVPAARQALRRAINSARALGSQEQHPAAGHGLWLSEPPTLQQLLDALALADTPPSPDVAVDSVFAASSRAALLLSAAASQGFGSTTHLGDTLAHTCPRAPSPVACALSILKDVTGGVSPSHKPLSVLEASLASAARPAPSVSLQFQEALRASKALPFLLRNEWQALLAEQLAAHTAVTAHQLAASPSPPSDTSPTHLPMRLVFPPVGPRLGTRFCGPAFASALRGLPPLPVQTHGEQRPGDVHADCLGSNAGPSASHWEPFVAAMSAAFSLQPSWGSAPPHAEPGSTHEGARAEASAGMWLPAIHKLIARKASPDPSVKDTHSLSCAVSAGTRFATLSSGALPSKTKLRKQVQASLLDGGAPATVFAAGAMSFSAPSIPACRSSPLRLLQRLVTVAGSSGVSTWLQTLVGLLADAMLTAALHQLDQCEYALHMFSRLTQGGRMHVLYASCLHAVLRDLEPWLQDSAQPHVSRLCRVLEASPLHASEDSTMRLCLCDAFLAMSAIGTLMHSRVAIAHSLVHHLASVSEVHTPAACPPPLVRFATFLCKLPRLHAMWGAAFRRQSMFSQPCGFCAASVHEAARQQAAASAAGILSGFSEEAQAAASQELGPLPGLLKITAVLLDMPGCLPHAATVACIALTLDPRVSQEVAPSGEWVSELHRLKLHPALKSGPEGVLAMSTAQMVLRRAEQLPGAALGTIARLLAQAVAIGAAGVVHRNGSTPQRCVSWLPLLQQAWEGWRSGPPAHVTSQPISLLGREHTGALLRDAPVWMAAHERGGGLVVPDARRPALSPSLRYGVPATHPAVELADKDVATLRFAAAALSLAGGTAGHDQLRLPQRRSKKNADMHDPSLQPLSAPLPWEVLGGKAGPPPVLPRSRPVARAPFEHVATKSELGTRLRVLQPVPALGEAKTLSVPAYNAVELAVTAACHVGCLQAACDSMVGWISNLDQRAVVVRAFREVSQAIAVLYAAQGRLVKQSGWMMATLRLAQGEPVSPERGLVFAVLSAEHRHSIVLSNAQAAVMQSLVDVPQAASGSGLHFPGSLPRSGLHASGASGHSMAAVLSALASALYCRCLMVAGAPAHVHASQLATLAHHVAECGFGGVSVGGHSAARALLSACQPALSLNNQALLAGPPQFNFSAALWPLLCRNARAPPEWSQAALVLGHLLFAALMSASLEDLPFAVMLPFFSSFGVPAQHPLASEQGAGEELKRLQLSADREAGKQRDCGVRNTLLAGLPVQTLLSLSTAHICMLVLARIPQAELGAVNFSLLAQGAAALGQAWAYLAVLGTQDHLAATASLWLPAICPSPIVSAADSAGRPTSTNAMLVSPSIAPWFRPHATPIAQLTSKCWSVPALAPRLAQSDPALQSQTCPPNGFVPASSHAISDLAAQVAALAAHISTVADASLASRRAGEFVKLSTDRLCAEHAATGGPTLAHIRHAGQVNDLPPATPLAEGEWSLQLHQQAMWSAGKKGLRAVLAQGVCGASADPVPGLTAHALWAAVSGCGQWGTSQESGSIPPHLNPALHPDVPFLGVGDVWPEPAAVAVYSETMPAAHAKAIASLPLSSATSFVHGTSQPVGKVRPSSRVDAVLPYQHQWCRLVFTPARSAAQAALVGHASQLEKIAAAPCSSDAHAAAAALYHTLHILSAAREVLCLYVEPDRTAQGGETVLFPALDGGAHQRQASLAPTEELQSFLFSVGAQAVSPSSNPSLEQLQETALVAPSATQQGGQSPSFMQTWAELPSLIVHMGLSEAAEFVAALAARHTPSSDLPGALAGLMEGDIVGLPTHDGDGITALRVGPDAEGKLACTVVPHGADAASTLIQRSGAEIAPDEILALPWPLADETTSDFAADAVRVLAEQLEQAVQRLRGAKVAVTDAQAALDAARAEEQTIKEAGAVSTPVGSAVDAALAAEPLSSPVSVEDNVPDSQPALLATQGSESAADTPAASQRDTTPADTDSARKAALQSAANAVSKAETAATHASRELLACEVHAMYLRGAAQALQRWDAEGQLQRSMHRLLRASLEPHKNQPATLTLLVRSLDYVRELHRVTSDRAISLWMQDSTRAAITGTPASAAPNQEQQARVMASLGLLGLGEAAARMLWKHLLPQGSAAAALQGSLASHVAATAHALAKDAAVSPAFHRGALPCDAPLQVPCAPMRWGNVGSGCGLGFVPQRGAVLHQTVLLPRWLRRLSLTVACIRMCAVLVGHGGVVPVQQDGPTARAVQAGTEVLTLAAAAITGDFAPERLDATVQATASLCSSVLATPGGVWHASLSMHQDTWHVTQLLARACRQLAVLLTGTAVIPALRDKQQHFGSLVPALHGCSVRGMARAAQLCAAAFHRRGGRGAHVTHLEPVRCGWPSHLVRLPPLPPASAPLRQKEALLPSLYKALAAVNKLALAADELLQGATGVQQDVLRALSECETSVLQLPQRTLTAGSATPRSDCTSRTPGLWAWALSGAGQPLIATDSPTDTSVLLGPCTSLSWTTTDGSTTAVSLVPVLFTKPFRACRAVPVSVLLPGTSVWQDWSPPAALSDLVISHFDADRAQASSTAAGESEAAHLLEDLSGALSLPKGAWGVLEVQLRLLAVHYMCVAGFTALLRCAPHMFGARRRLADTQQRLPALHRALHTTFLDLRSLAGQPTRLSRWQPTPQATPATAPAGGSKRSASRGAKRAPAPKRRRSSRVAGSASSAVTATSAETESDSESKATPISPSSLPLKHPPRPRLEIVAPPSTSQDTAVATPASHEAVSCTVGAAAAFRTLQYPFADNKKIAQHQLVAVWQEVPVAMPPDLGLLKAVAVSAAQAHAGAGGAAHPAQHRLPNCVEGLSRGMQPYQRQRYRALHFMLDAASAVLRQRDGSSPAAQRGPCQAAVDTLQRLGSWLLQPEEGATAFTITAAVRIITLTCELVAPGASHMAWPAHETSLPQVGLPRGFIHLGRLWQTTEQLAQREWLVGPNSTSLHSRNPNLCASLQKLVANCAAHAPELDDASTDSDSDAEVGLALPQVGGASAPGDRRGSGEVP